MGKDSGIGLLGLGTVGSGVAGVLTTKALGDDSFSISSVIQKESDPAAQTAIIVIMTYPAKEKAMQKALGQLKHLSEVNEVSSFIRVEE